MQFRNLAWLVLSLTLSISANAATALPEKKAVPAVPEVKSAETLVSTICSACHGTDGNSVLTANPKLAGQHPEYLVKQLTEFKAGKRANAVMAGLLLIAVTVVLALDKETVELLMQGKTLSQDQASATMLPIFLAMLFMMPLLMAYWFAPVLVGLNNLTAVAAMRLSFRASVRNILPFLLYGLIFIVLLALAIIPFGLGLIVVVPVMMTSLYTSYVDVFSLDTATPAT